MIRHSASTVNRSSHPPGRAPFLVFPGEDCFCLRYLLSDESWRIELTLKTMEMDFCVVFCGSVIRYEPYSDCKRRPWKALKSFLSLKDIGTQNLYYLYLLGILAEYLISYFGRFVAFSCWENLIESSTVVRHFENKRVC
jgi:hypothetical protein